eukprot:TRINITY_DN11052_c0_g1_i1.p1 TRINITY_DN11052_c0_g1~~TRINITY_DN11052_c0_g1_i1.p1  ORF type:complete len:114 (+),score=54.36 TRINITY_DN11052_c0_g1_i1:12-353(+)
MAAAGDSSWLKPFEERAAKAEERLARLEAALQSLDLPDGGARVPFLSDSHIEKLGQLRQMLVKAQEEQEEIVKQRDEAVKGQEEALAENARLKYRVQHLIRALKELEEGHASK